MTSFVTAPLAVRVAGTAIAIGHCPVTPASERERKRRGTT